MNACFCCVRFGFFYTKLRDWLGEMSMKWPVLYQVGCKTTTHSIDSFWMPVVCEVYHCYYCCKPSCLQWDLILVSRTLQSSSRVACCSVGFCYLLTVSRSVGRHVADSSVLSQTLSICVSYRRLQRQSQRNYAAASAVSLRRPGHDELPVAL